MTKHSTRRTQADSRRDAGEAIVPMADRLLLSELEVAALCGVSRHTVRRWKAAGLLRTVELPFGMRRNLYRRADVEAFLARARDRA